MALEGTLTEIAEKLRRGSFQNEQAVSQGIVLPVLADLGWDASDTRAVWPEYATGEGRVDFALCHPPGKPKILIEVKYPQSKTTGKSVAYYRSHLKTGKAVLQAS